MKEKICAIIKEIKEDLIDLNEYIYNNPELGNEEFKSCKAHIDLLKKHNFHIEEKYLGIETGFKAEYRGKKEGPTIAYLAEYDALPEIGHGCGHNLLGTVSTGAGIVLSKFINDIGGNVVVFGTPAEETNGSKVILANKGAFNDISVAMLCHPNENYSESGSSMAIEPIQFTFKGKTSHAAAAPERGINALDGAILTFNGINALREHILPTAKIHGVIIEGGKAANVVPDLAIAQFYVRANTKKYLNELSEKVKNCARGASIQTGTELEITNYEFSNDNLITNKVLSEGFTKNLKIFGVEDIEKSKPSYGSTDMGNVSQVCPSIHPYFGIAKNQGIVSHTKEFRDATVTKEAYESMKNTIGALVLTGINVIEDEKLLLDIKKEFQATKQ